MRKGIYFCCILLWILMVNVISCNALEKAFAPNPGDGQTGVSLYADLRWDHNGDSSSLYFGKDPENLQRLLSRSGAKGYDFLDTLRVNERYYWRVDVHEGDLTERGDLWTFRTRSSSVVIVTGCSSITIIGPFLFFLIPLFVMAFRK